MFKKKKAQQNKTFMNHHKCSSALDLVLKCVIGPFFKSLTSFLCVSDFPLLSIISNNNNNSLLVSSSPLWSSKPSEAMSHVPLTAKERVGAASFLDRRSIPAVKRENRSLRNDRAVSFSPKGAHHDVVPCSRSRFRTQSGALCLCLFGRL